MTKLMRISILLAGGITFLLRATPFIFLSKKELPEMIVFIGDFLPYAMMGLLVIFSLKGVSLTTYPFGIPELVSIVAVIVLHLWKRNMLISIGGGTMIYMLIIQYLI